MSDKVVKGKDVVLLIDGEEVACIRSYTLRTSTTFVRTTTAGSGKGATYKPKDHNSSVSLEGVIALNETGKFSLPDLRQAQLDDTLFEDATIVRTSADGLETYTDTFDFYVVEVTDTGAVGDFNTFQAELQINGDPVIS